MIKLNRTIPPIQLTPEFVTQKTREFKEKIKSKAKNKSVWNIPWLKSALSDLSSQKCAYCECSLSGESNYMEVEHFEDKDTYPDKVMKWDNLLPSCKRCNNNKLSHDVNKEPIVNPFLDNPPNELYFHLYRLKGKTQKGVSTEDVLNLNDPTRLVKERFNVGESLQNLIENVSDKLKLYMGKKDTRSKNKLLNVVRQVLLECQPDSNYSATCSTVLHSSDKFLSIISVLKSEDLWSDELNDLYMKSDELKFERRNLAYTPKEIAKFEKQKTGFWAGVKNLFSGD